MSVTIWSRWAEWWPLRALHTPDAGRGREPLRPGSENPTWEVTKPDVGGYEARCLCQTQKRMEIACPVGGWWGYVQAKRPRLATEILFRAPLYVPPRMHENRFPVDRQGFE